MEFEKRRNIPVKYNRELWDKTGNVYIYLLEAFWAKTFTLIVCIPLNTNIRNLRALKKCKVKSFKYRTQLGGPVRGKKRNNM